MPDVCRWLATPRREPVAHFTVDGELAELHRIPASHLRVGDTASVATPGPGAVILRCVARTPAVRWEPEYPWTLQRIEMILRTPGMLNVRWRAAPRVPRLLVGRPS